MTKNTIYLGQKIIFTKPVNDRIIIQVDKPALRRLSYLFLAAFAIIAFRAAAYSAWDMTNITLLLVVLVPYIMYAVYYYYTRNNSGWFIDLKTKKIVLGKIALPFSMIEKLECIKNNDSFSLRLVTKDRKGLALFTDDNDKKIQEAGSFLSATLKVPFFKK